MRIGIVLLSVGIGGTEKRLATLFKYLRTLTSHDVYLVGTVRLLDLLRRQQILAGDEETYAIEVPPAVTRVPSTFYAAFPVWRRALGRALANAAAKGWPDVIHYGIPISYFAAPRRYRRNAIVEAMASTHEWHIEGMLSAAARRGALINCLSEPIYTSIAARVGSAAPDRVTRSPGSLLSFRREWRGQRKRPQVAFVARLERIKNPLLFLEAIAILASRRRDFTAVILGDGRLQPQVDRAIARLGLADLVRRVFHHTPIDALADSLVFVSLQHWDNYPSQALLDAMECGCAVVASDVGSTRELVNSDTGILVPFDATAIADALHRLLEDPALAGAMGARGRALVRQAHSIEAYAAYILDLYERACDAVPTTP